MLASNVHCGDEASSTGAPVQPSLAMEPPSGGVTVTSYWEIVPPAQISAANWSHDTVTVGEPDTVAASRFWTPAVGRKTTRPEPEAPLFAVPTSLTALTDTV